MLRPFLVKIMCMILLEWSNVFITGFNVLPLHKSLRDRSDVLSEESVYVTGALRR